MFNILKTALISLGIFGLCPSANGDQIYNVTLNTTPLVGHPAGPFYLEFSFTDGSGYGSGNTTVTASNFSFDGGSSLGAPVSVGGVSGSLETGVTLIDSSFLNLFYEEFAPGLQLSFTLNLAANGNPNGIPDGFALYVLDSSGVPIPTLASSGADYFLTASVSSSNAVFNVYASDTSRAPSVGDPVFISAPTVTPVTSTPEPSAISLLFVGFSLTAFLGRKRLSRTLLV